MLRQTLIPWLFQHTRRVSKKSFLARIAGGRCGFTPFLPVAVRAEGKRIALSEIIIGPNRDPEDAREQLKKFLTAQSYEVGDIEYPEITISAIPPWNVSQS
jgi:hypothetical protein